MDEASWTSLPANDTPGSNNSVWGRLPGRDAIQQTLAGSIPSRETLWNGIGAVPGAMAAAPACIAGAFGNCFSSARRMQFDQDTKRSLLSNLYHDDSRVNIRDAEVENATLELRRRIQKAEYEKHRRLEVEDEKKLKQKAAKKKMSAAATDGSNQVDHDDGNDTDPSDEPEFTSPAGVKAADIRKMSVDELLSLDGNQAEVASSFEGGKLRKWLAEVDGNKSMEYVSYASSFEKQGFHSIKELSTLDEDDVDRALTEVGVNKFAHRARLRKAILRLSHVP
ncbi:Aste57867_11922 [Aphanomyces stellatus]|uniref:Aste57867_11922 protein n=1 Tax=Aphanomyces stellatus TaxID=120398 RepID=A0A485KUV3_9STRA|nr:hypothetical protein As57867_011877 [Aphanomyces stellatus]VFT88777.1 Aste57867_11922 [Aphanomyces stellatus]